MSPEISIVPAAPEHIPAVRSLFEEYAQWLGGNHLCITGFQRELDELPGSYAPPDGALLVALDGDRMTGCVALRKLDSTTCEMKRLFLCPGYRGRGLGRQLAQRIIEAGRAAGYERMRLDSMPGMMDSAIHVYESLGFRDIPAYPDNPIPGARHLEITLK